MLVKDNPARTLKILMAERDITCQGLAYLAGVTAATISGLRNGRRRQSPQIETAKRIAKALRVKTSDIWPDR